MQLMLIAVAVNCLYDIGVCACSVLRPQASHWSILKSLNKVS